MTEKEIMYETIVRIQGIKYIHKTQVKDCCSNVSRVLGIEKTEENFSAIRKGIILYFDILNSVTYTKIN